MVLSSSSLDFTLYLIFPHHHFELFVILYAPSLISFHVNLFYTVASDFLVEANRTHGDLINMRELPLLQSGLIWKKVWSTLISRSFLEQIFKGLCSQKLFIQGWESRSTGAASPYFTCYSGLEEPGPFEDVLILEGNYGNPFARMKIFWATAIYWDACPCDLDESPVFEALLVFRFW